MKIRAEPLIEFDCVLPGHDDRARLVSDRRGFWAYVCSDGQRGLGEVRASQAYGKARRLSRVEAARWYERLRFDAGLTGRRSIAWTVSPSCSRPAQLIAGGILLMLGLRPEEKWGAQAFTFARRFAAAYCGLTLVEARYGIEELHDRGHLVEAGRVPCGPHDAILWQLAELHLAHDVFTVARRC